MTQTAKEVLDEMELRNDSLSNDYAGGDLDVVISALRDVLALHKAGSVSGKPLYCGQCISLENGVEYGAFAPCPTVTTIEKALVGE
jgi:hypothetical protein